jgi:UDP-glucose 4-epimerase
MHFAASALVGESMTNPQKYFHNNVVNALKLADAAIACGVKKFVFSSTCATYGPPDRVPMTEDLPQRPINPTANCSCSRRCWAGIARFTGWNSVAFRYFNAAGASDNGEHHRIETHLIPNVLVALGRNQPSRFSPRLSDARRHFAADHSRRPCAGAYPGLGGGQGAYNLNGDGYSVRSHPTEKISGRKFPIVEQPRRGASTQTIASAEKRCTNWVEPIEANHCHQSGLAQETPGGLSGLNAMLLELQA